MTLAFTGTDGRLVNHAPRKAIQVMLGQTGLMVGYGPEEFSLIAAVLLHVGVEFGVPGRMHHAKADSRSLIFRRMIYHDARSHLCSRFIGEAILITWLEHLLDEPLTFCLLLYNLDVESRYPRAIIATLSDRSKWGSHRLLTVSHGVSLRIIVI